MVRIPKTSIKTGVDIPNGKKMNLNIQNAPMIVPAAIETLCKLLLSSIIRTFVLWVQR